MALKRIDFVPSENDALLEIAQRGPARISEMLTALAKAWAAGYKDPLWARDPDLALLHGDPEFERMFPEPTPES